MPTARELLEQADALMRRNRSSAGDDIPVLTDSVSPTRDLRVSLRPPPPQPPAAPPPDSIPTLTEHVAPEPVEVGDSMLREGEPSDWLEFEAGEPSVTGNAPDSIAIVPSVLAERSDDEALIESAEHEEIELTAPVEDDFEREMAPSAAAPAAPSASVPPLAPAVISPPPAAVSATALAATFAPVLPSTRADTGGAPASSPPATLDEAIDELQDAMGDESALPVVDDEWDVPLAADRDVPAARSDAPVSTWDAPASTWDAPAAKGGDVVADEEWAEPDPAELGEPADVELEESPAAAPGTEFDKWMGEAGSDAAAVPANRKSDDAPTAETLALPDEPVAVSSAAITPEPIAAFASSSAPAPVAEAGVVVDLPATPSDVAAAYDAPVAGHAQASAAAPAPAVAMAADQARWDVVAEEIRMQVLQRIDLFTDTGLREQLGRRLQPIVDRASADLVSTINQHVGELLRAYVAEALEREIENWRKNN